jgi:hypothetical protein
VRFARCHEIIGASEAGSLSYSRLPRWRVTARCVSSNAVSPFIADVFEVRSFSNIKDVGKVWTWQLGNHEDRRHRLPKKRKNPHLADHRAKIST